MENGDGNKMDIGKIKAYMLTNMYGDPFTDKAVLTIQNRIMDKNSEVGNIIRELLELAEKGEFK